MILELFRAKKKKKKKKPSLATITVIESATLDYSVAADLALILERRLYHCDAHSKVWSWRSCVISRPPGYNATPKDGRVVKVDAVLGRQDPPERPEILKRLLITLREG